MKLGILGGTFDPVHTGHIMLARECTQRLGLDRLIFVPAHYSPLKDSPPQAGTVDRLEMLKRCMDVSGTFDISTYELDKGGTSYTVDTLRAMREEFGNDTHIYFITGADAAAGLSDWKDSNEVLKLCDLVAVSRAGYDPGDIMPDESIMFIEIPIIDISSSRIRDMVKKNIPIEKYVPHGVAEYIRDKGLYK